jgi:hypothetical protein
LGRTSGRVTPGASNGGGNFSCWGIESVIVYQGALEPTKMWFCGRMPSSPSRLPAGANARPISAATIGVTEPHTEQNERLLWADDA